QLLRHSRIGETRQARRVQGVRVERQLDDRLVLRVEVREDRLLHFDRQLVANRRDLVPDVLRRLLDVLLENEVDGNVGEAVLRRALHAADAGNAGHRFLDTVEYFALDDVG